METISLPRPGAEFFTSPDVRKVLEQEVLPRYLPQCRWFGGKARQPRSYTVEDLLRFSTAEFPARIALVRVAYAEGASELYVLPIEVGPGNGVAESSVIATFDDDQTLLDALENADRRGELLHLLRTEANLPSESGELIGTRGSALQPEADLEIKSRYLKVEQSNSSIAYGDEIFLKLFRKPEPGVNPDVEITRFLSEKAHYTHIPPFAGSLEFRQPGAEPLVLGLAVGMVKNRGDAWAYALDEVAQFLTRLPGDKAAPDGAWVAQNLGTAGERIAQLARRTAEAHLALASDHTDPVFAPETITHEDQVAISTGIRDSARQMFELLKNHQAEGLLRDEIAELIALQPCVEELAGEYEQRRVEACKTRTHGDYHLGQVLNTGDDFILIDFEGEPRRTLAERLAKRSPLRDVAGMLRSFHYAAHSGLERLDPADRPDVEPWAELWAETASNIFQETWLATAKGATFLPENTEDFERILHAFVLEKAIYEVMYELNHRPLWVGIPVRGCLSILRAKVPKAPEEAIL